MRQHDNRFTLTEDERETLRLMFDYMGKQLDGRTGQVMLYPIEPLALTLACRKIKRLKDKFFHELATKEKPHV